MQYVHNYLISIVLLFFQITYCVYVCENRAHPHIEFGVFFKDNHTSMENKEVCIIRFSSY